jgi:hypothetical protein
MMTMRLRLTIAAAVAAVAAAVAGLTFAAAGPDRPNPTVIAVHLDHQTYADEQSMRADADLVVAGRVVGVGTVSRLEPVPLTDFRVAVDSVYKGTATETITVAMTGGDTAATRYVVHGVPALQSGHRYLFYLHRGDDGRFYPLAGSSAVGAEAAGSFEFSTEVTGADRGLRLATGALRKES